MRRIRHRDRQPQFRRGGGQKLVKALERDEMRRLMLLDIPARDSICSLKAGKSRIDARSRRFVSSGQLALT